MDQSKYLLRIWLLLWAVILSSCSKEADRNKIFFGGQIVNPSSTYVTLTRTTKPLIHFHSISTIAFSNIMTLWKQEYTRLNTFPSTNPFFWRKVTVFGHGSTPPPLMNLLFIRDAVRPKIIL